MTQPSLGRSSQPSQGELPQPTQGGLTQPTDLVGAMFGGQLELALLQVDPPDVPGLVHYPILVHPVVGVRPVHVLRLKGGNACNFNL